jgi:hypothetical protein
MLVTALGTVLTAAPIYYHAQNWFCGNTSHAIAGVPTGSCWQSNGRFWFLMIGLQVLFFVVFYGISWAKIKYLSKQK